MDRLIFVRGERGLQGARGRAETVKVGKIFRAAPDDAHAEDVGKDGDHEWNFYLPWGIQARSAACPIADSGVLPLKFGGEDRAGTLRQGQWLALADAVFYGGVPATLTLLVGDRPILTLYSTAQKTAQPQSAHALFNAQTGDVVGAVCEKPVGAEIADVRITLLYLG